VTGLGECSGENAFAIVCQLNVKPGWKDSNHQVLGAALALLANLARTCDQFPRPASALVIAGKDCLGRFNFSKELSRSWEMPI
jgi:hypothetical protein